MMKTSYEAFLAARLRAQRAMGRYLVERIEAGDTWSSLTDLTGPLGADGIAKGLDMHARALITLSGASRRRVSQALVAVGGVGTDGGR